MSGESKENIKSIKYFELEEKTIKDFSELENIEEIDLENSPSKTAGTWVLFAKEKNGGEWECLQVAKNINVKKEIEEAIGYLKKGEITLNELKQIYIKKDEKDKNFFINQFGKKIFEYEEYPKFIEILYRNEIAPNFDEFVFILIYKEDKKEEKRKIVEKYFAWETKAIYWRNGRPYNEEKKLSERDCDRNFKKIDEEYNKKIDKEKREKIKKIILEYKKYKSRK